MITIHSSIGIQFANFEPADHQHFPNTTSGYAMIWFYPKEVLTIILDGLVVEVHSALRQDPQQETEWVIKTVLPTELTAECLGIEIATAIIEMSKAPETIHDNTLIKVLLQKGFGLKDL